MIHVPKFLSNALPLFFYYVGRLLIHGSATLDWRHLVVVLVEYLLAREECIKKKKKLKEIMICDLVDSCLFIDLFLGSIILGIMEFYYWVFRDYHDFFPASVPPVSCSWFEIGQPWIVLYSCLSWLFIDLASYVWRMFFQFSWRNFDPVVHNFETHLCLPQF